MKHRIQVWRQRRKNERLHQAVITNDLESARKALVHGANPNARIGRNRILRDAISRAGLPMVKILVDAGADPLAGDPFGDWLVPYSTCAEQYGTADVADFFRMIEQKSPEPFRQPRRVGSFCKLRP
jgi:hypothetical protein